MPLWRQYRQTLNPLRCGGCTRTVEAAVGYYRFFLTLAALFLLGVGALVILSRTARGGSRCCEALSHVLLSLLGPLLVLLLGEGALLASNTTDGGLNLLVSRLWVERNVRLNKLGLRGRLPISPPPGAPAPYRICVLGDSVAFGQGIEDEEDRFGEVLGELLQRDGRRVEVVNVSGPGWNTSAELNSLRQVAKLTRFDLVILAYVPNDHFSGKDMPADYREALEATGHRPAWLAPLVDNSLLLNLVYGRLAALRNPVLKDYGRICLNLFRGTKRREWHRLELEGVVEECRKMGAGLAVVVFPLMDYRSRDAYKVGEIHRAMEGFCASRRIPFLDLMDAYFGHGPDDLWAGPLDSHPNERAHRLAAERIRAAFFPRG